MDDAREFSRVWSIVLAGGEGRRLRPMIRQWLGEHKPKQYCTFTGSRSLFQHTLDRADQLSAQERKLAVVARSHEEEASRQLGNRNGRLVFQPRNRDTAPGVFLGLTYVRATDPSATVVIYPSDHFVYPEPAFIDMVRHAVSAVELLKDRIVLLGVRPDHVELDYGLIQLAQEIGSYGNATLWKIAGFVEKPASNVARAMMKDRSLWNTLVVVGRLDALWKVGWRCLPSMMRLFEQLQGVIGTDREQVALETIYQGMPVRNFSLDILERVPDLVTALEMREILWSDWGRPDRIAASLRLIGKEPAFPLSLLPPGKRPRLRWG